MKREQALNTLREHRQELREMGVKSLSIFGSVARDEAGPGSDIDLLVEFSIPVGLFEFVDLKDVLEQLLGCKVDLATPGAIREEMREQVMGEAIRAS